MSEQARVLAGNRKARHDYFIEDTIEAGIELVGTEVKSVRGGKLNLRDSYASCTAGEVYVHNMHISPYEKGNIFNKDPLRVRKLLLHKKQINNLIGVAAQPGYSLIPLSVYIKNSRVKVELAVARGKKMYDKRAATAEKEAKRNVDRELKERNR